MLREKIQRSLKAANPTQRTGFIREDGSKSPKMFLNKKSGKETTRKYPKATPATVTERTTMRQITLTPKVAQKRTRLSVSAEDKEKKMARSPKRVKRVKKATSPQTAKKTGKRVVKKTTKKATLADVNTEGMPEKKKKTKKPVAVKTPMKKAMKSATKKPGSKSKSKTKVSEAAAALEALQGTA
jgi:hypothetical protein